MPPLCLCQYGYGFHAIAAAELIQTSYFFRKNRKKTISSICQASLGTSCVLGADIADPYTGTDVR